ncbi:MAG: ISL3 family transposase [Deltaproteobacteria bacterium]|nr:ISL3 family transposase [Deltaproteobacteria bacterium]
MPSTVSLAPLYPFSGWVVDNVLVSPTGSEVRVYLRPDGRRKGFRCPQCKRLMGKMRERQRSVLDIPFGTASAVYLIFTAFQGRCARCGTIHTFRPPGITVKAQGTDRLKQYVSLLARFMPADKIPGIVPISADTARRWDKEVLMAQLPAPTLDDLQAILVDEKSIGRGHQYLTVVLNAQSGEVLHLAEGKRKKSFQTFFDKLTKKQKMSIKAVGMDRAGAYKAVVRKAIPHAQIVYDKYHLIANYNEVIDKIRRAEWRAAEEQDKTFIKGQRYNLFRNPENLKPEQEVSLKKLLAINENLNKAYVLKDALKVLWTYKYAKSAGKYLHKWIAWAMQTGIEVLQKFACALERERDGILAFCKHRITSAKIEAFNATIGRIVRRACGYRDLEYLYLKIRQEAVPR